MHVKALLVKDQINVCAGQIIHCIPEMEVDTPTGHLGEEEWKAPGGSIMTVQFQLSIDPAYKATAAYTPYCYSEGLDVKVAIA